MAIELIRGRQNILEKHRGCVATIGNFDGVHLGHQQILKQVVNKARALHLPTLVITFEPLPQQYFKKDAAPYRMMRLRDKIAEFSKWRIDRVLCLHFNRNLANVSAEQFIENILLRDLNVQYLIVGDDFRFGHQRQGDFNLLQDFARRYGFNVERAQSVVLDEQRISSTLIRRFLSQGDIVKANQLLGHAYTLQGRIVVGDQRGRLLGFRTANIHLAKLKPILRGVYAVRIKGVAEQTLNGVANLGMRPSFEGQRLQLEVHILDFNQTIYGKYVQVEFLKKIRDEQRFSSVSDLQAQIQKDVSEARRYFSSK